MFPDTKTERQRKRGQQVVSDALNLDGIAMERVISCPVVKVVYGRGGYKQPLFGGHEICR